MTNGERVTLRDIDDRLERLEDRMVKVLDDHEARIRANERFINKALALASTASVFVSLVASYIWDKVTRQ